MPVDNVTACQSWSYCTLSNGHFYFWPKKGAPDLFRTRTRVLSSPLCCIFVCQVAESKKKSSIIYIYIPGYTCTVHRICTQQKLKNSLPHNNPCLALPQSFKYKISRCTGCKTSCGIRHSEPISQTTR